VFGADRQASVSRELSKIYEENIRGNFTEIIKHYTDNQDTIKGEIVIIVAGTAHNSKQKENLESTEGQTEIKKDNDPNREKRSKKWRNN
jgi:16S rRNA (cytidine1402-2'-O)-methyltransferase